MGDTQIHLQKSLWTGTFLLFASAPSRGRGVPWNSALRTHRDPRVCWRNSKLFGQGGDFTNVLWLTGYGQTAAQTTSSSYGQQSYGQQSQPQQSSYTSPPQQQSHGYSGQQQQGYGGQSQGGYDSSSYGSDQSSGYGGQLASVSWHLKFSCLTGFLVGCSSTIFCI